MTSRKSPKVGKRRYKNPRHLIGSQIPARQDKRADSSGNERRLLDLPIPYPGVLGNYRPASASHLRQPELIRGILRKVVIVDVDFDTIRSQPSAMV